MLASSKGLLPILNVVLTAALATASVTGQTARSGEEALARKAETRGAAAPAVPGLLTLSREIARLRASVDFVGEVQVSSTAYDKGVGPRRLPVVHLGSGLLAGPRVPGLATGTSVVLSFQDRLYRARYLGNDRSFAGYFGLRDLAHMKPLRSPRFAMHKELEKLGDLVLVVEGSSARLRLLSTWRFALPPIPVGNARSPSPKSGGKKQEVPRKAQTGNPDRAKEAAGSSGAPLEGARPTLSLSTWRSLQFYKLSEGNVAEAASVIGLDGTLVGLVCSPGGLTPANRTTTNGGKEDMALQVVVDGRLLLRRAIGLLELIRRMKPADPSLGVKLVAARSDPKDDAKGFLVHSLFVGGPGARAGVREGDRWLAIDGRALESFAQIRKILTGVETGKEVQIRYKRKGAEPETMSIKPD